MDSSQLFVTRISILLFSILFFSVFVSIATRTLRQRPACYNTFNSRPLLALALSFVAPRLVFSA